MGLFLATFANFQIAGVFFKGSPETSWRYVFLCGLIPAAVAFVVRLFVREPERWKEAAAAAPPPAPRRAVHAPRYRALTLGGFSMAVIALITWWSCNAFIPIVSTGLPRPTAKPQGLDRAATLALVEGWKTHRHQLLQPGRPDRHAAHHPRRQVPGPQARCSASTSRPRPRRSSPPSGSTCRRETRLYMYFLIGLTVFGVFGSFTYYLPELFPTRLRGTGAGFCYNVGRVIAAVGPFLVGTVASRGADTLNAAMQVLFWVGFVPLLGLFLLPLAIETKGRKLA